MHPQDQSIQDIHWQPSDLSPYFRQSIVDVGHGIHLCVEIAGDPTHPPLLFITGFGSQMMFWSDTFLKQFVDAGFFVIRFDNRDTGLSSKIPVAALPRTNVPKMIAKTVLGLSNKSEQVAYTLHDMADDVVGLIHALQRTFGIHQVNLVGASMGGMIAQLVAAKHGNLLSRLILLFSSSNRVFLRPPNPKQFSTFFVKPKGAEEKDLVRHAVWFMTTVGTPGHLDIKGTRAIAERRYRRCYYPHGVANQMNAILTTGSIVSFTKQITTPTLIMHGTKDRLLHPSHGKNLAKNIKHSRFITIDGMGHDLPAYYQPYLVQTIKDFCCQ
ncbi:alpha/beta fold hydrolase [Moraxella nasovis]|uniref:alpha/beta fold hydrolase n=1 Tax=Moraxella nasovis TaxID=2904121 RepID=UPI001F615A28|nr:alpha/beta hydrolase [Moraxella nasovis]UNU73432.1 alpha/beta fold hydrolase [Moraxella nasovis]